jgi:hypothetical protein
MAGQRNKRAKADAIISSSKDFLKAFPRSTGSPPELFERFLPSMRGNPPSQNHDQADAQDIQEDIRDRSVPAENESLVIFIDNSHAYRDPGRHLITPRKIRSRFGDKGQEQESGQKSIERNVKEAVRIEFTDSGNDGRVGEKEDPKDVGSCKDGEKRVHLLDGMSLPRNDGSRRPSKG